VNQNLLKKKDYSTNELNDVLGLSTRESVNVVYHRINKEFREQHSKIRRPVSGKGREQRFFDQEFFKEAKRQAETLAETPRKPRRSRKSKKSSSKELDEHKKPEMYTIKQATNILGYKSDGPLYYNKSFEMVKGEDGKNYITAESVNKYLATHERKNGRFKPRSREIDMEDIEGELEKPLELSRLEKQILRLHRNGNKPSDIAKKAKKSYGTIKKHMSQLGMFTETYVKRQFPNLKAIQEKTILGVKKFHKDKVREKMLEEVTKNFSDGREIKYLGLEGPHFCSYIETANRLGDQIKPEGSIIAEKDERSCNIMQSFVKHYEVIDGGAIFKELNIEYGELASVLDQPKNNGYKFDIANLDYQGYLTKKKIQTIKMLFENEQLEDEALLFVTLSDTPLSRTRISQDLKEGLKTNDQSKILKRHMKRICEDNNYELETSRVKKYYARSSQMISIAYKVTKVGDKR